MIEINLIPPQLRKKKKNQFLKGFNIPLEVIIGLGGGLIVLLIGVHIFLIYANVREITRHKDLQRQWDALAPEKKSVDAVLSDLRSLQSKDKATKEILPERAIYWAQKLNILSDNVPSGVWLRRINFEDDALTIEGSAIAAQNEEMINVHHFAAALKKSDVFVAHFVDLELGSIQRRKIKLTDTIDFIITSKLK